MRKAGILMPITSLPSPWGVGTLGETAREFVDFLKKGGQSCWQVLPIGPTGYGDSPYQSFSSFAGNPYLIDLDDLSEEGLLSPEEYRHISWGGGSGPNGLRPALPAPLSGSGKSSEAYGAKMAGRTGRVL